jgi:hypothetical protein
MPIYKQPTKVFMHEFAKEQLTPGQTFGKREAVDWFKARYPKIRPTTVQMHVEAMAVNSLTRKHHPSIKPGSAHDLFYKVGPGRFRLWNSKTDPAPIYRSEWPEVDPDTEIEEADDGSDAENRSNGSPEFAFERDLRNYLAKNLSSIEAGLKLYVDEDGEFTGVEFPVGGRFIDILALDSNGRFVVIELKVSRGYDRTMGQLLRYMGWVKRNLSPEQKVRGLIVASSITADLQLAASLVSDVDLVEYELSFKLRPLK